MQNMTTHHNAQATRVEDHGLPTPQRAGLPVRVSSANNESGELFYQQTAQKFTAGEMDNPFASANIDASETNLASDSFYECQATVLSNTRLDHLSLEQMLVGRGNPASFPTSSNIRWARIRKAGKRITNLNPDFPVQNAKSGTNPLSLEQMLVGRGNPANFPPSLRAEKTDGKSDSAKVATNVNPDSAELCVESGKNPLSLEQMLVGRGNPANFLPFLRGERTGGKKGSSKAAMNVNPDSAELSVEAGKNPLSLEQMLVGRGNPANFLPSLKAGWIGEMPSEVVTNVISSAILQRTALGMNLLSLEQMLVGRGNPANFLPYAMFGCKDSKPSDVTTVYPAQAEFRLGWPDIEPSLT